MAKLNRRVLFVLTSHGRLGDSGKPTGFFFEEMAAPYWAFQDAGYQVDLASTRGGRPPHDPKSLPEDASERPGSVQRFLDDAEAMEKLGATRPVAEIGHEGYDALFLPGGHGTMWDLPDNADLGSLIAAFHEAGKVVGAVCHGPAGLVGARLGDGAPLVAGRRVNCFTDEEERKVGLDGVVPFLLESRLAELGARIEKSQPFVACAVRDGTLVTGQNPRSAQAVAEKMLEALDEQSRDAA